VNLIEKYKNTGNQKYQFMLRNGAGETEYTDKLSFFERLCTYF